MDDFGHLRVCLPGPLLLSLLSCDLRDSEGQLELLNYRRSGSPLIHLGQSHLGNLSQSKSSIVKGCI